MTGGQITLQFAMGLQRASEDADVKAALEELGDTAALARLFGHLDDEMTAHGAIVSHVLSEVEKLRARTRDLSQGHFTQREQRLLENHPEGRKLLARLMDGDGSSIEPARNLLAEILRVRAELGLA